MTRNHPNWYQLECPNLDCDDSMINGFNKIEFFHQYLDGTKNYSSQDFHATVNIGSVSIDNCMERFPGKDHTAIILEFVCGVCGTKFDMNIWFRKREVIVENIIKEGNWFDDLSEESKEDKSATKRTQRS